MKSNVTNIIGNQEEPVRGGCANTPPRMGGSLNLSINTFIGYLIYFPDTDEFLYSHTAGTSHSSVYYTKEACIAYSFPSEQMAFTYSTFIDKSSEIVKLHDLDGKLVVCF